MNKKVKAVGMVVAFYTMLGIVIYGLKSIPEKWWSEYGTDVALGGFFILATMAAYEAALDIVKHMEESKKNKRVD
jgi:hypothetical protein